MDDAQEGKGPAGTPAWLITDLCPAASSLDTCRVIWLPCWVPGRGIPGQPSPIAPALPPPAALWMVPGELGCSGCSRAHKHLDTHHGQALLGTGTFQGLPVAWLGGEGVSASSPAQIDRQRRG